MNVERSGEAGPRSASVDADNPWPGLASFTEDTRAFFFGREKETDELVRLIRRNTLTVLFGQSGLGKSSLLQAGAFPQLRDADYLPLYLRMDHSLSRHSAATADADSPPLAEQVKSALTAAIASARADAPAFRADETLWEYFHRKDIDIWSAKNRLLTPVLAFDQFEEIFTLGRASEAQRGRGHAFLVELADLVENRAPAALRAKFDSGELDIARYNFTKPSCQVVLSLREDFLPDLEGLKNEMRSIMQSRMRVKRLNGTQALEIVQKPAPHLLSEGVAERVVEFVAGARGGSAERLAELEVEPALLSVICRELNERRRTLGQAQITADLVSGNRREILTDFYERSVTDLPEAMRTFVEDRLLTKSGFRDNLALETALEFPGVTRPLIDTLVSRRLVRLEDRLGVQRVELTHDVLAEVIRTSRDERQSRLALEETKRREQIARRRMWLARGIAAGLLVGLTGVSWIAWRAIRAERAQVALKQREAVLRQEAETRQRAEARRWSRSDTAASARLLEEGKTQEGLAFLVHAARIDRDNPLVVPRLLSALATHSFVAPFGPSVRLPSAISSGFASSTDFSTDGRLVGVFGKDRVFRLVNFADGRVEREIRLGRNVERAGMSGDFVHAVSIEPPVWSRYEAASGKQVISMPISPEVRNASGSQDGHWSAWTVGQQMIQIVDARRGQIRAELAQPDGVNQSAHMAANGTRMAAVSAGRDKFRVWSVPDGALLAEVAPTDEKPSFGAFSFSADGRLIAMTKSGGLRLYEAATGQAVGPLLVHEGDSTNSRPRFTPDGSLVISGGTSRTVKVWNVRTGELAYPPLIHGGAIRGLVVSNNGKILVTHAGDGFSRFWDLTTGRMLLEPFKPSEGGRFSVALDGRHLVDVTAAGEVRRLVAEPNAAHALALPEVAGALGSAEWVANRPATVYRVTSRQLSWFDVATGREVVGGFVFPEPIQRYVMSANGHVMVVTTEAGAAQAWTPGAGGVKVVVLEGFPVGPEVRVEMNAGGSLAAVIASNGAKEMRIWNLHTGRPAAPALPYSAAVWRERNPVSFSPDGKWVSAGSREGEAKVWEVDNGRLVYELKGMRGAVRRVEFSPDGKRLATVEMLGGGERLWDAATGEPVTPPLKHQGAFGSTSPGGFSRDGRFMLTFSVSAGSVVVWDVATGKRVGAQIEHGTALRTAVFSPDGSQVLTACADGAARLWDVKTSQLAAEPMRHGAELGGATFSPDGRFIKTATRDGPERIWAAPPAVGGRAPKWLLRLTTLHVGKVINDDGEPVDETAESAAWDSLRTEINALPADAPYAAWGKWLLADGGKRTLAPGFEITLAEAEARGLAAKPVIAAEADDDVPDPTLLR